VLGGWAWLTSVPLAVIGGPSKNVGCFSRDVADIFVSATNIAVGKGE